MKADNDKMEKTFLRAYEDYSDAIFRFCYYKTNDREVAKDLAQETFVKTWDSIRAGKAVNNFKVFLYFVARNTVIDFWRKKKSIPESRLEEDFFETVASGEDSEMDAEISLLILNMKKLENSDRELITLRFIEGLGIKEIATILNERENTVSVRMMRAVERLKKITMGPDGNNKI